MEASEDRNLSIKIHPLVLLNVSQHFSRIRAQKHVDGEPKPPPIVVGALMGKLSARSIEIRDSFEVPAKTDSNGLIIYFDTEYLINKEEHLSKVSNYEIVGWYSTGSLVPNSGEETIARLINDMKEASLFLKVDPFKSDRSTNELPMALFELETNGGLIQKSFNLEAKDAERIGVEDLAGDGSAGQEFGAAIRLYHRVQILRQYLKDVETGVLPADGEIIRPAQSLLSQLPKPPNSALDSSMTDYCAISTLASITQGSQNLQQLLSRFEVLHDKPGHKHRIRGLFI